MRTRSSRWSITTGRGIVEIKQIQPGDADWYSLVKCLEVGDDAQWVLDKQGRPIEEGLIFIGALFAGEVVGQLTLKRQPITVPETEWAGDRDRVLRDASGEPLYETLVQTFRVMEAQRRKGFGRALQMEALRVTKKFGCVQMRSWSSLDKPANYLLKLSLGFGFHPEIQQTASGLKVSGGYFVKRV